MAADFFPGYTFHTYQTFNYNTIASATYYKLENNVLYIRRVRFGEEHEPLIQDCMPLPLDPVLCEQLPSAPFDSLLCLDGSSSLFHTENGIDTARIPIEDIILQSELHTDTLVLLTKDANDQRRIQLVSQNDQGQYDIRVTKVLPVSTSLDILHAGEGELYVQWESGKRLAAFSRSDGGNWKLTGIQNGHYDDDFSVEYFGAYCASESGWGLVDGAVFGSLGNTDLLEIDLNTLPRNKEELRSMIDRTGWAAVYSHDEEDRAVLYCAPESNADAYAEFYNGTPVQIKEQNHEWSHVLIGTDGHVQGWMQNKYLVTGLSADTVSCKFPQLYVGDDYAECNIYTSAALTEESSLKPWGWLVGVSGNDLFVLLYPDGQTGYAPQEWFWEGNG